MTESARNTSVRDEDLMERFKNGDERAFVALYERYKRRVLAYCLKMVSSRELAEDVFQETFVRVARKAENFKSGNFAGWLFAIARNLCLNALRDNVQHVSLDEVQDSLPTEE